LSAQPVQAGSRRMPKPVRAAASLLAIVWIVLFSVVPVVAQTSTPTPTRTPYATWTPEPTSTQWASTPYPTSTPDGSGSTVIWGCWLHPGLAPVCTWGSYFELPWTHAYIANGMGETQASDPPSELFSTLVFLPPPNTRQITADCSWQAVGWMWRSSLSPSVFYDHDLAVVQ
jgi:hypothetical protein